jgi:hypothetical protein
MSTNYTVAPGHLFNYPADSSSEQIIKNAGGRSKLSEQERKLVKFKTAREGQNCNDMPQSILELYLSRGWVVESKPIVPVTPVIRTVKSVPIKEEDVLNG